MNAVWLADVMGRLIRQRVDIIAYWDLESHGQRGGFGLMSNYDPRPTYFTYQMYGRFGDELVFTEADDDLVTVYAALREEDGALTVMVINLADDAQTRTLELAGFEPGGDAEVWRFDEENETDVQLDDVAVADGDELTLPGRSLTLYIVPSAE
jgi:beta-xylosidase